MKAYTDLNQSKKLAEILPLESADMKWYFWKDEIDAPKLPTFGYSKDAAENYKDTEAVYLPCWSLAALLNIMEQIALFKISQGWVYKTYIGQKVIDLNTYYNEPIDACYEMIIKLNKLGLL